MRPSRTRRRTSPTHAGPGKCVNAFPPGYQLLSYLQRGETPGTTSARHYTKKKINKNKKILLQRDGRAFKWVSPRARATPIPIVNLSFPRRQSSLSPRRSFRLIPTASVMPEMVSPSPTAAGFCTLSVVFVVIDAMAINLSLFEECGCVTQRCGRSPILVSIADKVSSLYVWSTGIQRIPLACLKQPKVVPLGLH